MAGRTQRDAIDVDSDSDVSMDFGDYDASSDIEDGVGAIQINRNDFVSGPGRGGTGHVLDSYETCHKEILEVFPDISHDHIQQAYDKHIKTLGSYRPQEVTIAQTLIERILDKSAYPKEKDRLKELKRKRSQGNSDAEEAARWKYADMRDDPLQYSRVAYVP